MDPDGELRESRSVLVCEEVGTNLVRPLRDGADDGRASGEEEDNSSRDKNSSGPQPQQQQQQQPASKEEDDGQEESGAEEDVSPTTTCARMSLSSRNVTEYEYENGKPRSHHVVVDGMAVIRQPRNSSYYPSDNDDSGNEERIQHQHWTLDGTSVTASTTTTCVRTASDRTNSDNTTQDYFPSSPSSLPCGGDFERNLLQDQMFNNSILRLPFVPAVFIKDNHSTRSVSCRSISMVPQEPIEVRHMPPSPPTSGELLPPPDEPLVARLRRQGLPAGLALQVALSRSTCPKRFWSIDNGTGMNERDAREVHFFGADRQTLLKQCSRWEELQGCVQDQIRLAGMLPVSTLFCLRNGTPGRRKFAVAANDLCDPAGIDQDVRVAVAAVQTAPAAGHTPLSKHLYEFHERIRTERLGQQQQQAVVVLSTCRLPTDAQTGTLVTEQTKQDFIVALIQLSRLPVRICIRLCTEERDVVEFYQNLKLSRLKNLVVMGKY